MAIPTARAAELDFSLSAGATYSDNAGRTSVGKESDTRAELGLQLGYAKKEGRLTARVGTNLQYHSYFEDSYEDELVGQFDGSAAYWFIPDRFSWIVQDNFGQTFIDRAAVETPDNRQNTNYFSTGPDIFLPLGERTQLTLQGRWSDVTYETSEADSERLEATLGLIRRLSARSSISLGGSAGRVDFHDPTGDLGYDRQSAYLGFDTEGARTTLNVRAGYTALHDFGDTFDGPLLDVALMRETSARSTLTLRLGTNYTDTADMFRLDQDIRRFSQVPGAGPFDENEDVPVSTDPFQSDYASLTWAVTAERSTFSISGDWRREDYTRDELQNRDAVEMNLFFSRTLTRSLTGRLYGTWRTEDFGNSGISYDASSYGAGLDWDFARSLSLSLDVSRWDGSGDTSTGTGTRDYTENRASLRITYTPGR